MTMSVVSYLQCNLSPRIPQNESKSIEYYFGWRAVVFERYTVVPKHLQGRLWTMSTSQEQRSCCSSVVAVFRVSSSSALLLTRVSTRTTDMSVCPSSGHDAALQDLFGCHHDHVQFDGNIVQSYTPILSRPSAAERDDTTVPFHQFRRLLRPFLRHVNRPSSNQHSHGFPFVASFEPWMGTLEFVQPPQTSTEFLSWAYCSHWGSKLGSRYPPSWGMRVRRQRSPPRVNLDLKTSDDPQCR